MKARMVGQKLRLWAMASLGAIALAVPAFAQSVEQLRTTAYFATAAQRPITQLATIDFVPIGGDRLVNLVMGRDVYSTNVPNQVLTMLFPCDLTSSNPVSLAVYDLNNSNTIWTIAGSVSLNTLINRQVNVTGSTNDLLRFISQFQIQPSGNSSNGVLGGYLTVAGRVDRDPVTGCLTSIAESQDRQFTDKTYHDMDVANKYDRDVANKYYGNKTLPKVRAGLAHMTGVMQVVSENLTQTVLVASQNLSIRYALPMPAQ